MHSATNGAVRVAIKPGSSQPSEISWGPFEIKEGILTLEGVNWVMRMTKDEEFTLEVNDTEVYAGILGSPGASYDASYVELCITAENEHDNTQRIRLQGIITNCLSAEEKIPLPMEFWKSDLKLYLHSLASNGWRCIEVPYAVSEDFRGDLGRLTLESNWYEWGTW